MAADAPSTLHRVLDPARYPPEPGEYGLVFGLALPAVLVLLGGIWLFVRDKRSSLEPALDDREAMYGIPFGIGALIGGTLIASMLFQLHPTDNVLAFGIIKLVFAVLCVALLATLPWEDEPVSGKWFRCEKSWLWRTPLLWLLTFPLLIASALASVGLMGLLGLPITEQGAIVALREGDGAAHIAGWYVMAGLAAPLAEEFAFRLALFGGVMYGLATAGVGRVRAAWIAGVVSIALFVVVHGVWEWPVGILPLTTLSIVLTLSFAYSRSLWPPVALHALHNCTVLTLQFFVVE
jgi:membrane protease YdiL (CAAX protease family)